MSNSIYATVTRQSGLLKEMQVVANNIANSATSGYRSEGVLFAEHIRDLGDGDNSLSMANAEARMTDLSQGTLSQTGGTFDFAIEGDGFFLIETPAGTRLSRAGSFTPTPDGQLVTPEGYPVLDAGNTPVFVPGDAVQIAVAPDGTLSADGVPVGQIGLVRPENASEMIREDGVRFKTESALLPADDAKILQGFVENSNVQPVDQITRMIEVQRAYEMGQSFLEREDSRLRSILKLVDR